jgi:hypothetical protein
VKKIDICPSHIFDSVRATQICIIQTGSYQRNLMDKNYLQIWFHSTPFISETTKTKSNLSIKSSSKFHRESKEIKTIAIF